MFWLDLDRTILHCCFITYINYSRFRFVLRLVSPDSARDLYSNSASLILVWVARVAHCSESRKSATIEPCFRLLSTQPLTPSQSLDFVSSRAVMCQSLFLTPHGHKPPQGHFQGNSIYSFRLKMLSGAAILCIRRSLLLRLCVWNI